MSTEIIYGVNPVLELLRAGLRRCHKIFVAEGRKETQLNLCTGISKMVPPLCKGRTGGVEVGLYLPRPSLQRRGEKVAAEGGLIQIQKEVDRAGVAVEILGRGELNRLAQTDKHQGVAARCDPYPYAGLEETVNLALEDRAKGFLLILDGITDPQNLGSLVRTALLMGVHGIIIPADRSAKISPTVVKASAGATEHLRIVRVTNIARTIAHIKEKGFWVAGADGESHDSIYLHEFTGHHVAVVLGSEGGGIRRLIKTGCDYLLAIPMRGAISSHNVSVAGAVFMGEIMRQRMNNP